MSQIRTLTTNHRTRLGYLWNLFLFSWVGAYVDAYEEIRDFFRSLFRGQKPVVTSAVIIFGLMVVVLSAGVAYATDANEPVVLSDDIHDRIITVISADGTVLNWEALVNGDTGRNNRSGMGDGTNPSGGASGNNQSGNTGTNNPTGGAPGGS